MIKEVYIDEYMRAHPSFYRKDDFHQFVKSFYASKYRAQLDPSRIPVSATILSIAAAPVPDPDWLDIKQLSKEVYEAHPHRYASLRDKMLAVAVVDIAQKRKLRCINSHLRMRFSGFTFEASHMTKLIDVIDMWIAWQMKQSRPTLSQRVKRAITEFFTFWK